jgi:hypothetical protein
MKTSAIVTGAAGVVVAAMLSASSAVAAPVGSESANDVVAGLKAHGYNVMLNGSISEPLSECHVTGVHNPDAADNAVAFTTVYVDVTCPDD